MRKIPISRPFIGEEEKQAVAEVLDSGMLVQGPKTAALEERFAALVGTRHAVATSSGTTALHLALLAHGIGRGDEVITTPFTFMASASSILFTGATPVFVDIDERSFNMNPELLEALVTPRTKAIMPVHLYGLPCDMDPILAVAKRHGLAVIEDAAQAVGATYKGRLAGSFGTGCFSLYATKNIMCGEGGMITTDDDDVAERCRMLRNHGSKRRYYHEMLGYNFRMMDLCAAIGLVQMDRLEGFTSRRRANAAYLNQHLTRVVTPSCDPGSKAACTPEWGHVWHQYTVRLPDATPEERDAAVQRLQDAGIGCGVFYPLPVNRQAPIAAVGGAAAHVPVAERTAQQVFSLPVHPLVSEEDLEYIVRAVNAL